MSLIQTFPGGAGGSGDSIQVTSLPPASASELGNIYQYVGITTPQYINGFFYECVLDSGTYKWVQKDLQPTSSGVVDGYYNTTDGKFYKDSSYTTEIVGENNHLYISVDTNKLYRFDGTQFVVEESDSLTPTQINSLLNLI